jgi:acetylornithine deacetylase/succinyl-diaminopimelate desuccinylase-like protein
MHFSKQILLDWYHKNQQEILRDFFAFLRMPSISTDSQFAKDVRSTAFWLRDYLEKMGLKVELWETTGYPVIFAKAFRGEDFPTILIYQHYDVQPVDPLNLWETPPFEPSIRGNKVFARGASDNKGQCFYSIQAVRALLELSASFPCNICFFIEGEEESGSQGTESILEKKKKELQADYLLVIDCNIPSMDRPGIDLGMRGITALTLILSNSKVDLHSGTHGGIALNPNRVLVELLGKLWDQEGRVRVPGFYDDIKPLSESERGMLDFSFDREAYQKTFGVQAFSNEKGVNCLESNWLRPTLEINGIQGGYTGEGFKTVIPAESYAKISCRLVPNQDPEKVTQCLIEWLKQEVSPGIAIDFAIHKGARAFRISPHSKSVQKAKQAIEYVFEKPCSFVLEGGSVPIIDKLSRFSNNTLLLGVALTEDCIHAPNEHFDLLRFEKGFLLVSELIQSLSVID